MLRVPSASLAVNLSALMPSISRLSAVNVEPSLMRSRNSLKASAALSVPKAPACNPLSSRLKNCEASAPPLANCVEYSVMESRKSSEEFSPFWKPVVIKPKACSLVSPNLSINSAAASTLSFTSMPNASRKAMASSVDACRSVAPPSRAKACSTVAILAATSSMESPKLLP